MTTDIRTGMLFIENDTCTPDMVEFAGVPYPEGWQAVTKPSVAELGKALERTGRSFFYVAGGVHANGFGFDLQSRTKRALAKLMESPTSRIAIVSKSRKSGKDRSSACT